MFLPTKPAPASPRHMGLPTRSNVDTEAVTVRTGETLWDIAAEHLGPGATDWEIAAEWPAWYAANRTRIAGPPHPLTPGIVLTPPGHTG